jgi:hypothetical protein
MGLASLLSRSMFRGQPASVRIRYAVSTLDEMLPRRISNMMTICRGGITITTGQAHEHPRFGTG